MTTQELFKTLNKKNLNPKIVSNIKLSNVKRVNGYLMTNRGEALMIAFNETNNVIEDMPYGWHYDVAAHTIDGRSITDEWLANSSIGTMFKVVVEYLAKKYNAKYELYAYKCKDDSRYMRLEVYTSHEILTDILDHVIYMFNEKVRGMAA